MENKRRPSRRGIEAERVESEGKNQRGVEWEGQEFGTKNVNIVLLFCNNSTFSCFMFCFVNEIGHSAKHKILQNYHFISCNNKICFASIS